MREKERKRERNTILDMLGLIESKSGSWVLSSSQSPVSFTEPRPIDRRVFDWNCPLLAF